MDKLISHHSLDIQWGNHDVVWMGAAAGSKICIMNVIRICARYGQLEILEENYGISILPIAKYAMENFEHVEDQFFPKSTEGLLVDEVKMTAQINKAATLILFKLEEEVAERSKEFELEGRALLTKINFESMSINLDGIEHELLIKDLPNVDPDDPAGMSEEEIQMLAKLQSSFLNNNRLQQHVAFLFEKGSIYKVHNGNLLYHGCIPMNEDGSYTEVNIKGRKYKGKQLLDKYERMLRKAYVKGMIWSTSR